ncbi:MAG: restriction endonuclease subunit S [Anaerolineales bacterium]|nr:restriction endonuclease subunit S [Anaerolineales bacterium]
MTPDLKPYPEYKDSGVPWLGQIPCHWELRRFKSIFSERVEKGFPDEPLLAATQTKGVVPKDQYENRTVIAQKDLHLLKLVHEGDYVISLRSFQGGIEYAHYRGIISPAYTILKPPEFARREYYQFLFKSFGFIDSLTLYITGIREGQNIDHERLSRSLLPMPPIEEQILIGKYLHNIVSKINIYIRAKRRQIELLDEQKQAIIQQAVTRGLDPHVRLKPSGVEWLGDIPEHWEILRSKFVFREVDKRSSTGQETHLSMSQKKGLIPSSDIEERRLLSESYIGAKICEKDDLVLNRLKAHLGVFALALQQGLVSPDYTIFRPIHQICPKYFEAVLRTPACRVELRKRAKGIVQGFWRLYTDDFYNISLPVPSIREQEAIIARLESELAVINRTIESVDYEIDLIREYRTRLIADVVTGKVDLRGVDLAALPGQEDLEPDALLDEAGLDEEDEMEEAEEASDEDNGYE